MKSCERIIVYPLAVFSFLFSIIVLFRVCPRLVNIPIDIQFDYLGFIVGALSFLVGILAIMFGYNIFYEKDKIKRDLENAKSEIKSLSNSIKDKVNMMESDIEDIKDKLTVRSVFVKGNIEIHTSDFQFKDLVAFASMDNIYPIDEIIHGNLVIQDAKITPNTIYFASGDILSYVIRGEGDR